MRDFDELNIPLQKPDFPVGTEIFYFCSKIPSIQRTPLIAFSKLERCQMSVPLHPTLTHTPDASYS
jgi:hypothetical protein